MNITAIKCPIDNSAMTQGGGGGAVLKPYDYENVEVGSEINKHIHMGGEFTLSCGQGHQWTLKGELFLSRTA